MDRQPHGQGHVETGGLMADFLTAGLDPAFWMHHANVDRLWETYARDLGHGYPFPDGHRPADRRRGVRLLAEREFRFLRPDARRSLERAEVLEPRGSATGTTRSRPAFNASTSPAGRWTSTRSGSPGRLQPGRGRVGRGGGRGGDHHLVHRRRPRGPAPGW